MTATASRKRRGAESQAIAAGYFRAHGWPFAESTGAGRSGADITGVPAIAVEVKARRDWSPLEWLRQARAYAGHDMPVVIHRPDGLGPACVADWPVTMRLEDWVILARTAGYGTPLAEEEER